MRYSPNDLYKSVPKTIAAFQWSPLSEDFKYPKWFSDMIEEGRAFTVLNNQEKFLTVQNKRGVYKAFEGDWVCKDEFQHIHVISQSTFNDRYQPLPPKGSN